MVAEVLFGVLYTFPRPAAKHTRATSRLGGELDGPFDQGRGGPGGWIILDEPELHFGAKDEEDILVPDLTGWRRQRMPEVPDVVFFTLAPDWVCEVLSDSTRAIDRSEKMKIYARERVSHLWFVDPVARTLEVFQLLLKKKTKRTRASASWNLIGVWRDDARVRAEPFDAIELQLGSLWK
jgi:Uma2 family endonuclease